MSAMDVSSAAVGLPVSDLAAAVKWYRQVLELAEPDLQPADGVVEFKVGSLWLQLGEEPTARSGAQVVIRFGVDDAPDASGYDWSSWASPSALWSTCPRP